MNVYSDEVMKRKDFTMINFLGLILPYHEQNKLITQVNPPIVIQPELIVINQLIGDAIGMTLPNIKLLICRSSLIQFQSKFISGSFHVFYF